MRKPIEDSDDLADRVLGKRLSDLTLCYLSCPKDAAGGFLGAVLLTDYRTRPLEFGHVSPVRPTTMQRLLYGRTLEIHVLIDVIAKKLTDSMTRQADLVLVDSEPLLGVSSLMAVPVVYLAKPSETDAPQSPFTPITYKLSDQTHDPDAVVGAIATLESHTRLYDPFDRIAEALKEVLRAKA
jgi:hypothetical protein